jgi:glycosyltransferase involved in cell wall biosynthesis
MASLRPRSTHRQTTHLQTNRIADAMTAPPPDSGRTPEVSLVVVVYDMAREAPRTIDTIRSQVGIRPDDIEVIVVDNGSPTPFDDRLLDGFEHARSIRLDPAPASPVTAVNTGLAAASSDLIGVFIDGARMLSPGLVAGSVAAAAMSPAPVVASLAFHLGAAPQMESSLNGYDQACEDLLLETVDWRGDGYSLFSISVLAASSSRGWFGPMGECNSLFMRRKEWDRLGGYDLAFDRPGGGLANHDAYRRACELSDTELFVVLGEGTFHQYHGGAATSGNVDRTIWDDYERIRSRPYRPPSKVATIVGRLPPAAIPVMARSLEWLTGHSSATSTDSRPRP